MIIESLPGNVCVEILNGRYKSSPDIASISAYVDNVIEGYIEDGVFYTAEYANDEPSPCVPDPSKIYIDENTYDTYKYSDTDKKYVKVSE